MWVSWICKLCGKYISTEMTYNSETGEYHAKLPEVHDKKNCLSRCNHDWYPVEIRRGL